MGCPMRKHVLGHMRTLSPIHHLIMTSNGLPHEKNMSWGICGHYHPFTISLWLQMGCRMRKHVFGHMRTLSPIHHLIMTSNGLPHEKNMSWGICGHYHPFTISLWLQMGCRMRKTCLGAYADIITHSPSHYDFKWAAPWEKHVLGHMRTLSPIHHLIMTSNGPPHEKTCLWAHADSEGPDRAVLSRPSLFASRVLEYYRMYEWRENARMILCTCVGWSDSAHLCMFEGIFWFDTAQTMLKDVKYRIIILL